MQNAAQDIIGHLEGNPPSQALYLCKHLV